MKYYYKHQQLSSRLRKTKDIQDRVLPVVKSIKASLESLEGTSLNIYWTRRNTFGYVFADFIFQPESKREWLIGKGEKDLFTKIKDDYFCLVLSVNLDRNFSIREIPRNDGSNEKALVININHFKEFLSILRNRLLTVGLFLYRFTSSKEEDLIRAWLRNYHSYEDAEQYYRYDLHGMMDVLQKYRVEQPRDLEGLIQLAMASQYRTGANPRLYEEQLEQFKKYVNDETVDERTLHNFLFDNPWMIDIQYMLYKKEQEKRTAIGNLDINLIKDVFGYQRVAIIELKKSVRGVTKTSYRGEDKPAIIADVGNAISQTIHYIENAKSSVGEKKRSIHGIVIVGRRLLDKDDFIATFNDYLHGIRVLTYDDVIDNAGSIVEFLKNSNSPKPLALEVEKVEVPAASQSTSGLSANKSEIDSNFNVIARDTNNTLISPTILEVDKLNEEIQPLSMVLILGELHPEHLIGPATEMEDEIDRELHLNWLRETFELERKALQGFGPNKVFVEARPSIVNANEYDDELIRLRIPEGMDPIYIEGEYESDTLEDTQRESNMADKLANYLTRDPHDRVALICGARHASPVARMLGQKYDKKGTLNCDVRYMKLADLEDSIFKGLDDFSISV